MKSAITVFLLSFLLLGCGRYIKPIPPESLSPEAIALLETHADDTSVTFKWKGSDSDIRGKRLKFIDGYNIYRSDITHVDLGLEDKPKIDYDLITMVPDTHIAELKKLQKEAEEEGKISRKVKIEDEKKVFEFTDSGLQNGNTYLYKIIGVNQGDVEGAVPSLFLVKFIGAPTVVETLQNKGSDADLLSELPPPET